MNINRLIASLMATIVLSGCGSPPKPKPRIVVFLAIDYSASTESIRRLLLSKSLELATDLDASNTRFVLYRFASSVQEVYSGVPDDESAFALELKKAASESDLIPSSQYPRLLKELASRASEAPEEIVRIVIAGDGGNEFVGNRTYDKMLKDSANSLQNNPKVEFVRMWGVETGWRESWRKQFNAPKSKLEFRLFSQGSND